MISSALTTSSLILKSKHNDITQLQCGLKLFKEWELNIFVHSTDGEKNLLALPEKVEFS